MAMFEKVSTKDLLNRLDTEQDQYDIDCLVDFLINRNTQMAIEGLIERGYLDIACE